MIIQQKSIESRYLEISIKKGGDDSEQKRKREKEKEKEKGNMKEKKETERVKKCKKI